jgi:hypothetical protein
MGTGFNQGEIRKRVAWNQAFVPELNQTVGYLGWIKAEVFRLEPLAAPPVSDRYGYEHAALADGVKKRIVGC